MTFVRKKNKTFKWPVVVREPSETDAGVYEENEFIAQSDFLLTCKKTIRDIWNNPSQKNLQRRSYKIRP